MATIGNFKTSGSEFTGSITILSVQAKNIRIVPEETRANDNAPSNRVCCGPHKIDVANFASPGEPSEAIRLHSIDDADEGQHTRAGCFLGGPQISI